MRVRTVVTLGGAKGVEVQKQLWSVLCSSKPRFQDTLHTSCYSLEALPSSCEKAQTSLLENERVHEVERNHPS